MNTKYDPKKIEPKWQKEWEAKRLFHAKTGSKKKKFYALVEFPYPSGEGLHTGHVRGYTAMDIVARKRRMEGREVLYPIGWDAFGLPTENFAIKTGIHPEKVTKKNTDTFRKQMKSLGFSFDWSREINTTDPEYYKWTQWIFLQLFKKDLAYKAKMSINWCPSCKIGLANEEAIGGVCERCGKETETREKEQWILAITKYADRLGKELDLVDYLEKIKIGQRNWIGRSEGTLIRFPISNNQFPNNSQIQNSQNFIEVFTTRVDTIFGCTYVVVAPEIIEKFKVQNEKLWSDIRNKEEVEKYFDVVKKKTEQERNDATKEKNGVRLEGIAAVNPFTDESVPVFVADYVLGNYGTGAVMAVPAHDERDMAFAKKYGLPIRQSVALNISDFQKTEKTLQILESIHRATQEKNVSVWVLGGLSCAFHARIIYREHSDIDLIVKDNAKQEMVASIFSELGFREIRRKKTWENLTNIIYANSDGIEIDIGPNSYEFGLTEKDFEENEKILNDFHALVLSARFSRVLKEFLLKNRKKEKDTIDWEYLNGKVLVDDGFLVNSGEFTGLSSKEAREKMTAWLMKRKLGKKQVNYKLRDWVFSRQRYWGEPIPLVKCEQCGWVPVSEKDLPITLPKVKSYVPTDTGESPLAVMETWVKTACPKCDGPARRETDTMPNWAGSSWYYLAYVMQGISDFQFPISKYKKAFEYWTPVDWYNGGMEHTTLHLLYSRFWHKFLFDIDVVPTKEPYQKRTSHGLVLAEGGVKMSKSKGNVVNPDDIVRRFGADTLRVYEMFMGPFDQDVAWSMESIAGSRRFLEKAWKLQFKIKNEELKMNAGEKKLISSLHKTIKKVSEDIEGMRFNTAISALMILANEMEKEEPLSSTTYSQFLILLSPFAPHIAEELWSLQGNKESIMLERWPKANPKFLKEEMAEVVVQVNGKLRARLRVPAGSSQEEVERLAREEEVVWKHLDNKAIRKVIFVPDRLVNFVIS